MSDFLNIAFKYTELSFIFFCEDMANKWWYSLLFLCMVVVELSDVFQNVLSNLVNFVLFNQQTEVKTDHYDLTLFEVVANCSVVSEY